METYFLLNYVRLCPLDLEFIPIDFKLKYNILFTFAFLKKKKQYFE